MQAVDLIPGIRSWASDRAMVFHGQWQDILPHLGEKCADVCITDPPYTEHVQANIRSCGRKEVIEVGFDPLVEYAHVRELLRVTRRWCLFFCALEQFGAYEKAAGGDWTTKGHYVRSGVWRKIGAPPQRSGDRPANACEGIAHLHARPVEKWTDAETGVTSARIRWNGGSKKGEIGHAYYTAEYPEGWCDNELTFPRHTGKKLHPTQKPDGLCEQLIRLYSDPGECVLDPYAGSGAISAAALRLGRTTIAIESDAQYVPGILSRLEAAERYNTEGRDV